MGWRLRLTRAEPGFVPWDVQHLLPAPSVLLAPFSSPPWDPPGCVSWSCQAFPIPAHPPLTSPTLLPVQASPRALSHPPIVPGAPSLVAWGGKQLLPTSRRSHPGAQGHPVNSEGSQLPCRAAPCRAPGRHGKGGERGFVSTRRQAWSGWGWGPGGGGSLDPWLWLLCTPPPLLPRARESICLLRLVVQLDQLLRGQSWGLSESPTLGTIIPSRVLTGC